MSTTYIPTALRRAVRERAEACCEYCLIPETLSFAPHEIDHIIAEKHGGKTVSSNLALACTLCNKHKGSDLASIDPQTGQVEPLFHPRQAQWEHHFQLQGAHILPQTPQGRVTVRILQLNQQQRVMERELCLEIGLMRPPTSQ